MKWVVIYLLVGLIIASLQAIFSKNIKKELQEVSSEELNKLVQEGRLDKGEYGDQSVFSPSDPSDIWSDATIEAKRDADRISETSLKAIIFFGTIFLWGLAMAVLALKFVKKQLPKKS